MICLHHFISIDANKHIVDDFTFINSLHKVLLLHSDLTRQNAVQNEFNPNQPQLIVLIQRFTVINIKYFVIDCDFVSSVLMLESCHVMPI